MLEGNTTITSVDLGGNAAIGDESKKAVQQLTRRNFVTAVIEKIKTNTIGKEIRLYDEGIGDDGVQRLCTALTESKNTSVTTLYLQGNGITDVSAKVLATMLEGNKTITSVDLTENPGITAEGAKDFARHLEKHKSTAMCAFLQKVTFFDSREANANLNYEPSPALREAAYANCLNASSSSKDAELKRMKEALDKDDAAADKGGLTPGQKKVFLELAVAGDLNEARFFLSKLVDIAEVDPKLAEQLKLYGKLRSGDFVAAPASLLGKEGAHDSNRGLLKLETAFADAAALRSINAVIASSQNPSAPQTKLKAYHTNLHDVAGPAALPVFGNNSSLLVALAAANKPALVDTLVIKAATEHLWRTSAKFFFFAGGAIHLLEFALMLHVVVQHKHWAQQPTDAVEASFWMLAVLAAAQAAGIATEVVGAAARSKTVLFQQVANVWFVLRAARVGLMLASAGIVLGAAGSSSLLPALDGIAANATAAATPTSATTTTTTATPPMGGATPTAILSVEAGGAAAVSFAWVALTTCLGSLYYMLPHPAAGPLVLMIVRIMSDTYLFVVILLVSTVGLALALLVFARDTPEDPETGLPPFASASGSLIHSMGYFVFGGMDLGSIDNLLDRQFVGAAIAMIAGGFLLSVMLMNLMIAILSDSYERAQDEAEALYWVSKLQIVVAIQNSPARLMWYVARTWVPWSALQLGYWIGVALAQLGRLLCCCFFWRADTDETWLHPPTMFSRKEIMEKVAEAGEGSFLVVPKAGAVGEYTLWLFHNGKATPAGVAPNADGNLQLGYDMTFGGHTTITAFVEAIGQHHDYREYFKTPILRNLEASEVYTLDKAAAAMGEWYTTTLLKPVDPFDYFKSGVPKAVTGSEDMVPDSVGPGGYPQQLAVLIPASADKDAKPDKWQGMLFDMKSAVEKSEGKINAEVKRINAEVKRAVETSKKELKQEMASLKAAIASGSTAAAGDGSAAAAAGGKYQPPPPQQGGTASVEQFEARFEALEAKVVAGNAAIETKMATLEATMSSTLSEILKLVQQKQANAAQPARSGRMVEQTMVIKRMVPEVDEFAGFKEIGSAGSEGGGGSGGGGGSAPETFGFASGDF